MALNNGKRNLMRCWWEWE